MKIKVYVAITDGGYGEHHANLYPSREKLVEDLKIDDEGYDEYDYYVDVSEVILDTTEFEVIE